MSGYVTRLLALSVAVTALAALAWAEPAHALHELECPAFQGTHIDPATGKQRCGALSNETRKQAVRVRRLLQEQKRRTQTSPEVQRQRNRPRLLLQEQQRRTRDLEVQRTIRTKAQARITDLEIGRQKQAILRNAGKRKQPALDLRQSIALREVLNRQAAVGKQRRERSRLSGLVLQRNLLEQGIRRVKTDLLDDQKLLTRILRKKQQRQ